MPTPAADPIPVSRRRPIGPLGYALDALVLLVFLALIAVAFPQFVKARDGWQEDEVRANLKVIQVALERYATDHGGEYPLILYGGHPSDTFATSRAPEVSEFPGDVDWLMEAGYLEEYPQNPFRRGSREPVLLQAKDFFPAKFRYAKEYGNGDAPRVNIWGRGGTRGHQDRSRQWVHRTIGGPRGDRMWEVSEGQRHPQFLLFFGSSGSSLHQGDYSLALAEANPDLRVLREPATMDQQTWPAVGNFYYYPLFTGLGNLGSFHFDDIENDFSNPMLGTVAGYKLAGYGGITTLGDDCYTWFGDLPDHSLNGDYEPFAQLGMNDACMFTGPDGRPDGVVAIVTDPQTAKSRGDFNANE